MRDFIVRTPLEIIGRLPIEENRRYSEWLLSGVLERLGYKMGYIFIRDDHISYERLSKKYHYLCADVYVRLNEEQKRFFHTDKDTLIIAIPARYLGNDNNWKNLFYVYADDLCIRYGQNGKGEPYRITFTEAIINKKRYQLYGDRLDWDVLEFKEQRLEEIANREDDSYEYEQVDGYYDDEKEYEDDLLEAFGGDLSNRNCR